MKRFTKRLFWGAVALTAYYAYKNRAKIEDKMEDEKVVHFIDKAKDTVEKTVDKVKKEIDGQTKKSAKTEKAVAETTEE